MTPADIAKSGSEHAHQMAVFARCAELRLADEKFYPLRLLFAVHNQGHGDVIRGARAKAEGVKAGVPDLVLPVARSKTFELNLIPIVNRYNGLYIELKTPEKFKTAHNGTSPEQRQWIVWLQAQGYAVYVCGGWEQTIECLTWYISD